MRRLLSLLALTLLLSVSAAAESYAISTTIVISEFRTRGPAGASDEFVEIWNMTIAPIDISGWLMRGSSAAGTVSTRATVPAGTMLGMGCYYLFVNAGGPGGIINVAADQTYTTGFLDDGGIAITLPDETIVDQVGMGAGSAFGEGASLAPTTNNIDQSYERLPGGGLGNGVDTDNNATDFMYNNGSSNPMNMMSCIPTRTLGSTWGQIKQIYR